MADDVSHSSLSEARLMKAVGAFSKTKTVEYTELLTDGEVWQVKCSCGFKTPLYRREKTARRHYRQHTGFPT